MRLGPRQAVACLAALTALVVPATAGSVVQIGDETADRADFDVRTGKLKPTQAQRAAAARLGAAVTWNRFGTPASLSKRGKYLAQLQGGRGGP
jgi:hypothetical protein